MLCDALCKLYVFAVVAPRGTAAVGDAAGKAAEKTAATDVSIPAISAFMRLSA